MEREGAGAGGDTGARAAGRPGDILHAAEPPTDPRGAKCGNCQVQPHRDGHIAPGPGGRCSRLSPPAVTQGGASVQAWEHCRATCSDAQNKSPCWPWAAPSRGVSPTDSPGFGFFQLPGPSAPSYPSPTRPWNQPWGPPLALPCLLPGPTRGVPAGTLSAPETLTRPPPLCGPPALVPHPQHQLPQCRDPQNGWN